MNSRAEAAEIVDLFLSHASEDKDFVRPLARALLSKGLSVWYDELSLSLGDSLRRSIDAGLARATHGVVVVSPDFLRKEWPLRELDALLARESAGARVILPVWHNVSIEDLLSLSPMLADRVATSSSRGVDRVVEDILSAIGRCSVHRTSDGPAPEALLEFLGALGPSGAYPQQIARQFKCHEDELEPGLAHLVRENLVVPAKMASTMNPIKYHLTYLGRKRFEMRR